MINFQLCLVWWAAVLAWGSSAGADDPRWSHKLNGVSAQIPGMGSLGLFLHMISLPLTALSRFLQTVVSAPRSKSGQAPTCFSCLCLFLMFLSIPSAQDQDQDQVQRVRNRLNSLVPDRKGCL